MLPPPLAALAADVVPGGGGRVGGGGLSPGTRIRPAVPRNRVSAVVGAGAADAPSVSTQPSCLLLASAYPLRTFGEASRASRMAESFACSSRLTGAGAAAGAMALVAGGAGAEAWGSLAISAAHIARLITASSAAG